MQAIDSPHHASFWCMLLMMMIMTWIAVFL